MKKLTLVVAVLLLNGCVVQDLPELLPTDLSFLPTWVPGVEHPPGEPLSPGESATLHFFTVEPNFDTGVGLTGGSSYSLNLSLLSNWNDAHIGENENGEELDELGFADSVMPYEWVSKLKRSANNRWFELMLYQPNCRQESMKGVSELRYDSESGDYNFVASCTGPLSLFVNDTRGFYGNNSGFANIVLTRVN